MEGKRKKIGGQSRDNIQCISSFIVLQRVYYTYLHTVSNWWNSHRDHDCWFAYGRSDEN